jgi:hypothetical protein
MRQTLLEQDAVGILQLRIRKETLPAQTGHSRADTMLRRSPSERPFVHRAAFCWMKRRSADNADTQTLARKLATLSKRRAWWAYPELKKALRFEAVELCEKLTQFSETS